MGQERPQGSLRRDISRWTAITKAKGPEDLRVCKIKIRERLQGRITVPSQKYFSSVFQKSEVYFDAPALI
jgi:hypothetical protein